MYNTNPKGKSLLQSTIHSYLTFLMYFFLEYIKSLWPVGFLGCYFLSLK